MDKVSWASRIYRPAFLLLGVLCLILGLVFVALARAASVPTEPTLSVTGPLVHRSYLLYQVSLEGDVAGSPFRRSAELFVTGTIAEDGKAPNTYDVLLLSGQPVSVPELGAINLATNTFFFGRDSASRPTFDLARVSLRESGTGLLIQIMPNSASATQRNTFNAKPGWFKNVYDVNGGTLLLDFGETLETVSGQVQVTGTGLIFFLSAPYRATITGVLIHQGEF